MAGEIFQYEPVDEGLLRLVHLRPGCNIDEPIECELVSCHPDNAPPYEALSYFWGSPNTARGILLQGSTVEITESLYNALRDLRHPQATRILWIDAFGINQRNLDIRSKQIPRIGEICAKAKMVVVYLGAATATSDHAMDYLMQVEKQVGMLQHPPREGEIRLEGLRDILSRPWFQRALVVQDIFNARTTVVYCGSKSVSSRTLARVSEMLRGQMDQLLEAFLDLMAKSGEHVPGSSKFQLHDVLQKFQRAKASDPRDKIYALLSLTDDSLSKVKIVPDYSISQKDLIRAVIANLCFCELACVPEPPYITIDEFLPSLGQINSQVLENIFESSQEIDIGSLLQHGSHYIKIDQSLIEAAGRNKTRGNEMVGILLRELAKADQLLQLD
jgi:Heterokaryon incompatibility protein (HET)